MDPRNFLTTAHELATSNLATEADLRTAVSRAYYAAFNTGLEHLARLNPVWERLNHGEVARYLSNSGSPHIETAGKNLERLHRLRIIADYRMRDPKVENMNTVMFWLRRARDIIDLLDQYCHGPVVANGIMQYERKIRRRWR